MMTYEEIKEAVSEMYYGRRILKAPAELISNAFHIDMKELPFDEYYAAQVRCLKCNHEQLSIWPALSAPIVPSQCTNCGEMQARPICTLPPTYI